jgi:IclR family transcriptional regulator, KDG regulon repressor
MLNTVKKVGPVLDLFTPDHPEWGVTQIAEALEMPKSSVHAVLSTLAEIGLLTANARGRYRLGWKLLTLSERMRAGLDFREHALPVMREVSAKLKETTLLAVLDHNRVLYVERAEGSHPTIRLAGVQVGARLPIHITAVGKVLMSDLEATEVRQLLSQEPMMPHTSRTITTIEEFESELRKVRGQGFAYDRGEAAPDICCVAAPIRDSFGSVVAAMSVSVPSYRFERRVGEIRDAVGAGADAISRRLTEAAQERRAAQPVDEQAEMLKA